MEQSKLDKYLKIVEESKKDAPTEEKEVFLPDLGENFTFRTLSRSEKRELNFGLKFKMDCLADVFSNNVVKKTIYNCCELSSLAAKAKEQKLISNYYQIIEMLFTSSDLIILWEEILKENHIGDAQETSAEVNDLKN